MKRRSLLKAMSTIPVVAALPNVALAGDKAKKAAPKGAPANLQSETEGMGQAMQYKHNAKDVKNPMFKKGSNCLNCVQYNKCAAGDKSCKPVDGKKLAKADYAPCAIFSGKVVAREGWCMSWAKKA